jgi:hypothetical protein
MATKKADPTLTKVTPIPNSGKPTMPKSPPPKSPPPKASDAPFDTDDVIPSKGREVMSYKDRMAALVASTKKAEAPAGGFISTKGSRLSVGDVRLPNDTIRAIVIEYRKDNEFYPNAYVAGQSAAPICSAIVRPHEILTPWRLPRDGEDLETLTVGERGYVSDSPEPQVPEGHGCDSCGMLEWGSAKLIKGKQGSGKGKACRESRRLHLFAADQCTTPDDVARAPYMTMIPPPTSLDNFKRFANEATTVLGLPVFGVVVDITLVPHDAYMFMIEYKIVEAIKDEGILNALLTRHEQLTAKHITPPKPSDDEDTKAVRGSNKF